MVNVFKDMFPDYSLAFFFKYKIHIIGAMHKPAKSGFFLLYKNLPVEIPCYVIVNLYSAPIHAMYSMLSALLVGIALFKEHVQDVKRNVLKFCK